MEPSEEIESEAGRTPLVKPMSMKALVAVSGRSSTVLEVSNVRVISLISPVIPVSENSIVHLNTKGLSLEYGKTTKSTTYNWSIIVG